jgi:uncharacterized protein
LDGEWTSIAPPQILTYTLSMKIARFDFVAGLRELLRPDLRHGPVELHFQGRQTVKHLIESLGIPHTEIGTLQLDDRTTDLGTIVMHGDEIRVWPAQTTGSLEVEPVFVLDGHLGRLASHLRMLGLDCLYRSDFEDAELVDISIDQERILLTRDRRLLMHKVLSRGYLVRSLDPLEQLHEVVARYSLTGWIRPFQRCMRCNHPLEHVEKESILEKLEPLTKKYYDEFKICPACHQVYWKGSHYERMRDLIETLSTQS